MKTFDEHLNTYLLDDPETTASERRAIETHLASCADCRRSLDSYRRARRLIAPREALSSSPDFVERIFSKVEATTKAGASKPRSLLQRFWPAAAGAVVALFVALVYFGFRAPEATTQDLLAGGDGFYEWATASGNPSDEDVLKVVLEDL